MPGFLLSVFLVSLAPVCHVARAELDEEIDASWRGVLQSFGGNTAE